MSTPRTFALPGSRAVVMLALAAAAAAVWWWGPGAEKPPGTARERAIAEERTTALARDQRAAPLPQPVEREPVARTVDAAMQRPDTIAGIVTAEDGAPIDGAVVWTTGHDDEVGTDAAGRFAFARAASDTSTVAIRVVTGGQRGDHEALVVQRWVSWGTHDLAFVLRRRVDVQVDLVFVGAIHGARRCRERGDVRPAVGRTSSSNRPS